MSHKILLAWLLVLLFLVSPASSPSPVHARPSAVFTVNDTTDATDANPGDGICETAPGNGVCTLRAAIQETNALPGMDIIILPSGIYTLTIPGANEDNAATGDLDIKDDLLLVGAGTDQTIVDGNGLDRVFDIFAPANVTLGGLTVQGGYQSSYSTGGGGIRNAARANINNTTIFSNTDKTYGGGGIYNTGSLSMDNVKVTNNTTGYCSNGGGIYNNGNMVIATSLISGNVAFNQYCNDYGGGIYNFSATLILTDSQIINNQSRNDGGGIYNYHFSLMTATNTTFMGNHAGLNGGGIGNEQGSIARLFAVVVENNSTVNAGGGISNFTIGSIPSQLTILNARFSNNTAVYGGALANGLILDISNSTLANNVASQGGAVWNSGGPITLTNVTVSQNAASSGGSGLYTIFSPISVRNTILSNGSSNCYGAITSLGHNLEDGNSCGLNAIGDLTNTNPRLGPLQDNGGNTLTHALLFGSPAIDAGDNNGCPRTDQRGWLRPFGRACDIGAFELHYPFWFPIIFFNAP